MTNERAIELLHRISDSQFDGPHGDERREALEMAVRALKQNLVKESGGLVQDLVKDCISRKMAIDAFVKYVADGYAESPNDFEGYMGIVKKLPSAQFATDINVGDTISRQALCEYALNQKDKCVTPNDIMRFPSAQPEKRTDKRTETHECDLINREQAIDAVKDLPNCRNGFSDTYDKACIIGVLEDLPTAQPQWIPCSERLPRTEDFMIITILDDGGDIPIIYSDFGWYASVGGFWVVDNETRKDVIAWMPLPTPYGGKNE